MDTSNEIILYQPDMLMVSTGSILELLQKGDLSILRRSIFSVIKDYFTVDTAKICLYSNFVIVGYEIQNGNQY
jgi:hypothetical protein